MINRTVTSRLQASALTLAYEQKVITRDLNVTVPDRQFSVIIGPNACGKSTLLRALCRLLKPRGGQVLLDGKDIHQLGTKALARQLGLLPQHAIVPEGISVAELVARGRYPHQSLLKQWSDADRQAVDAAMAATNISDLAARSVDELSGGQRQRVWVAMVLAQQTPLLLLDEPTTWLDIAHQIELLDLFRQLNQQSGHTLIAVLHDLNQACRYADNLIVMHSGQIVAQGKPAEIISAQLVQQVFGMTSVIIDDPVSHTPLIVPCGRFHPAPAR
ncbi:ABC transporter ATP-binding protein [Erwiniaceae bacterium BAC15a-03b]|uniref:ABC transporter ATP-binding protein n=1 Tax=Winslowiella arboricola TaxID=2978220 RepID=A0A9J6PU67_9GAMM|nr:ABC transporter ATP-binding protein [Winslowiella arboricola]MCU5772566.1 ABC transporter ATP-binding protein [Winslowiella arboricola]MCU5779088.1 ABC transporter ATP-binding protein [Winslowiella arboricola]